MTSAGRSHEQQFRVVRRRNRVPLSCCSCRTRKLKCDRSHPCGNCVKRDGPGTSSCFYATPPSRKKHQNPAAAAAAASSPDDMQNRIDRLEGLVLSLMHGGANIDPVSAATAAAAAAAAPAPAPAPAAAAAAATSSSGTTAAIDHDDHGPGPGPGGTRDDDDDDDESDVDDSLATSLGVLRVDAERGKAMYVGQEHWHTILADILEVKTFWANHKSEAEKNFERVLRTQSAAAREGPTLLMGAPLATDAELRAELPPKSTVLTLCARYFGSRDNAVNIIHAPSFHQQLRRHWEDPGKSSIMWLGLLYSVLCLAMLSYHRAGDQPPESKGRTLELAAEYRMRTVQCLITGDYTRPSEYTVETMVLYLFGEYSSRWDADLAMWLTMSLVTRIAYRMGYHRDAKWFPALTPFQAEMRRRTWALVRTSDVFFSHHISLPSMICDDDCDTQLPHNLFDEDFGPDTEALPPSRPSSEPTPISYLIAKVRLCLEMGNILQATTRVRNQAHYEDILRFDASLREIRAELPPHLRLRAMDASRDPVTLIMARFNLDILYQRIMCQLHRKYMARARHNPRYAHSRRSAVEASLETLGHLAVLHREMQPGGRLQSLHWFVKSIATKDFLLPAMLILLDLHFESQQTDGARGRQNSQSLYFWTPEQRREMVAILERTRDIWKGLVESSPDAVKASRILEVMLDKIKTVQAGEASSEPPVVPRTAHVLGAMAAEDDMRPEHSAAMTLGMLSGGLTPNTTVALPTIQNPGGTAYPGVDLGAPSAAGRAAMGPEFMSDGFALHNPASPFSMFGSNDMDVTNSFDWDSLDNYAQNANWGIDQSFQFFSGLTEPQTQHGGADGPAFAFGGSLGPGSTG